MSNSSDGAGAGLGFLLVLVTIGSWLGSGYLAWNWIEPHSFGSTLLFLFVWPLFGYFTDTVLALVIASVAAIFSK
jgi:hypothetical protein